MSNSWGHTVNFASKKDAPWLDEGSLCVVRGCPHTIAFRTTYRYVTGRAGRVSRADRYICEEHARKFATKHKIEMPAAQPLAPGEREKA